MTNNKNLTPSEILRTLADGKIVQNDKYSNLYKLDGSTLVSSLNYGDLLDFSHSGDSLDMFLNANWHIFTPPEKPKKLSDRFKEDFPFEMTIENWGGLSGMPLEKLPTTNFNEIFHNWLKQQEEDGNN